MRQATGKEALKQLQSAIQITRDFDVATGRRLNPLKINLCDTDRADGEGSAANRGAVWDEDRKFRETSWLPSHLQRQQRQDKPEQEDG